MIFLVFYYSMGCVCSLGQKERGHRCEKGPVKGTHVIAMIKLRCAMQGVREVNKNDLLGGQFLIFLPQNRKK